MKKFSVLMSLYIKEKPEYLRQCLESLESQTVKADEWVIVEDGPLTDELYAVMDDYESKYPGLIKRVKLKYNMGLGAALREGVEHCSYELIARMDTDDISREDRFEKQLMLFESDPELDICGTYIDEFDETPELVVSQRTVPVNQAEIEEYQKKRDAFNHVSVMFKKSAVLRAGNYISCPLMEDTYLWVRMIQAGIKCTNIPEFLVHVRLGKGMIERRGGWSYFLKYREGRKMVMQTGYIGKWDYFVTIAIQFIVALMPSGLRRWMYTQAIHR